MRSALPTVMPVLVTGTHAFFPARKGVDGRNKSGDDNGGAIAKQIRASQFNRSI